MKLYEHTPLYLIQLAFRRGKEQVIYLTLCDTTIEEVKSMLSDLFKDGIKKDNKHKKTRIEIRERFGGKNGKYSAFSFYGYSAKNTRQQVINFINNK